MTVNVENLTKFYGTQKAIDGISFEVKKGEVVGFLGPNGAGKTTTLKIISCYTLPTSGNVTVCGSNIYDDPLKIREHIGYLPERNPLYDDMYVYEYLLFISRTHHIKGNSRILDMIELTGLTPERHKKIGALSKGYRQRVGLAQALIHEPDVLLLDEPTAGLDPNQIVEMRNLIKEIGKEKTIILSSHIMQEVQAMCTRLIIINNGSIIADDSTSNILMKPTSKIFIKVQFKNPPVMDKLEKIAGVLEIKKAVNQYIICASEDIREKIFHFATETNNIIIELSIEVENLERVFQQLTHVN